MHSGSDLGLDVTLPEKTSGASLQIAIDVISSLSLFPISIVLCTILADKFITKFSSVYTLINLVTCEGLQ